MTRIAIDVPDNRIAEMYRYAADLNAPDQPAPAAPAAAEWTEDVVRRAHSRLTGTEKRLLWRIADARGQRVPLSELSRDLGFPTNPALDQDFPGLTKFCADPDPGGNPPPSLPIVAGGTDTDAWYWMEPLTALRFREAFGPVPP